MKKYIVGAMALISLSIAASAAVTPSSIPGITVTESSCEDGYIITSSRAGTTKTAYYDSCLSDGIVVSDAPALPGDTVNINGVDVYFPAGYTTPTVAADNTCAGGFDGSTGDFFNCKSKNLSTLSDGYLNLSVGGHLYLQGNQLTNVDGLANLTRVTGRLDLSYNQITNLDGLANLTRVEQLAFVSNPKLQDLSGLNNVQSVISVIYLDAKDYAVKLDANSYICQNFDAKVQGPTKAQACNP